MWQHGAPHGCLVEPHPKPILPMGCSLKKEGEPGKGPRTQEHAFCILKSPWQLLYLCPFLLGGSFPHLYSFI